MFKAETGKGVQNGHKSSLALKALRLRRDGRGGTLLSTVLLEDQMQDAAGSLSRY